MVREAKAFPLIAALLAGALGACDEGEAGPTAPFRVWVLVKSAYVRLEPSPDSHVVAFHDEPELQDAGWLGRPGGGYVSTSDVRLAHPSTFAGEHQPTLYEGDTPVMATLVSTGKAATPTQEGIFRVWHKVVHDTMHGPESDPYVVEEVPQSLFFHRGQALHGAFWHDAFGNAVTHGCVNLSVKDAAWLFEWAPPPLPRGFHAYSPEPAGRTGLWVLVERRPVTRAILEGGKPVGPRDGPAQVSPLR